MKELVVNQMDLQEASSSSGFILMPVTKTVNNEGFLKCHCKVRGNLQRYDYLLIF